MNDILIINYFFGDIRVPTARMVEDVCEELKKKKLILKFIVQNLIIKILNTKKSKKNLKLVQLKFLISNF